MIDLTIVALDPSGVNFTGLAVVSFDACGQPTIRHIAALRATAKHRDSATETTARIAQVRALLAGELRLHCGGFALDIVAYEVPPPPQGRPGGWQAYAVLFEALGAYKTLTRFASLRMLPVHVASCKSASGTGSLARQKTTTSRQREEKRQKLKSEGIAWANQTFGLILGPTDDAIADALAVAVAAWKILDREQRETAVKRAQKALPGMASATKTKKPRRPPNAALTTGVIK